jgi:hypothetical protein
MTKRFKTAFFFENHGYYMPLSHCFYYIIFMLVRCSDHLKSMEFPHKTKAIYISLGIDTQFVSVNVDRYKAASATLMVGSQKGRASDVYIETINLASYDERTDRIIHSSAGDGPNRASKRS